MSNVVNIDENNKNNLTVNDTISRNIVVTQGDFASPEISVVEPISYVVTTSEGTNSISVTQLITSGSQQQTIDVDITSINATVTVTNDPTPVLTLNTPGPTGAQGPAGPPGTIDGVNIDAFVLTSSFNPFTASYYLDSASFDARINAGGGGSVNLSGYTTTSSFNAFTASYTTGSFTGSFRGKFIGTSSWAFSSSQATTASYITGSTFGSTNPVTSASYALTASFALNAGGAGFPFSGNAVITGSLLVSGSSGGFSGITGSLFGTASWATRALTASFLPVGIYAITSSWAQSSSQALTASYVSNLRAAGSYGAVQFSNGANLVGATYLFYDENYHYLTHGTTVGNQGLLSFTNGASNLAQGQASHAEGSGSMAIGNYSHAEGLQTVTGYRTDFIDANTDSSGYIVIGTSDLTSYFVVGQQAIILNSNGGYYTSAEVFSISYSGGVTTIQLDYPSDYVGYLVSDVTVNGSYAHAEGVETNAIGAGSHAEGVATNAIGAQSHAEGNGAMSTGFSSHAEGASTNAVGLASHAEGSNTFASGNFSHTEGRFTSASGLYSHAEGSSSVAFGIASHAGGLHTIASGNFQTTFGRYNNLNNTTDLFVIGNGTSNTSRSDIFNISTIRVNISGSLIVTGSITGSLFGTASWTSNYNETDPIFTAKSGSFTTTSSFNSFTSSYNTGSFTGSFTGELTGTAATASYVLQAVSSSYATTASYALNAGGSGVATLIDTIGARVYTDDTFITAGSKGYKHIPYNADIIKTRTIANTNGYIDVNIKRNGTTLGTISLSNQSASLDTTLSGWTTTLNEDDLIEFYVSQSSTYITDISIFIDIQST